MASLCLTMRGFLHSKSKTPMISSRRAIASQPHHVKIHTNGQVHPLIPMLTGAWTVFLACMPIMMAQNQEICRLREENEQLKDDRWWSRTKDTAGVLLSILGLFGGDK
mmetsp:Transcript_5953/g.10815  ORF Transcript_5953/g.10815 Transcript_5953/m.10815 type:complete len:108 (-) Transcript_5953:180-503(-)